MDTRKRKKQSGQNVEVPTQLSEHDTGSSRLPPKKLSPEEALNRKVLQRAESSTAKANTQLAAAYRQKNLRFINMLIAEFAKRKELRRAKRAWNLVAKCELTPTVYTLTNMVNAYVRCGKMDRAVTLIAECQHFIQPNEVTFTALIKGYAESGQVTEAAAWVERMREHGVELNLRTYQIILRSCVHWGFLDYATKWWNELCNLFVPSEPCFEYWIKALCQAGLVTQAWEQIDLAEAKFSLKATPTVLSDVATACAVAGLFPQARRALLMCRSSSASSTGEAENVHESKKNTMSRSEKARNRRKMRKITKVEAPKQPEDKDAQFLLKRAAEVADSCKQTSAYLAGGRRSNFTSFLHSSRVLFLPSSHHLNNKNTTSVPSVSESRGNTSAASRRRHRKKPISTAEERKPEEVVSEGSGEMLNFQSLFKNKAKVIIEVCSGNGDWIINKALAQPSINWVAIEVRVDRCYAIFTRMMFQFVPNLLILCGDARAILQGCIPLASIKEVYVNYPEPPGDQEDKLLNGRFFALVSRVLESKGRLIVVSDDASCIHGVLNVLKKTQILSPCDDNSGLTTSLTPSATSSDPNSTSSSSEVTLEDYGSSYFDQHWKQRHQMERFMLQWGKDLLKPTETKKSDEEQTEVQEEGDEEEEGEQEGDQEEGGHEGDQEEGEEEGDQQGDEGDEHDIPDTFSYPDEGDEGE